MSVMRSKLQLVGGTAIYIASKFEEIFPPEIADFAYITDDTYTKSQIVRMEQLVLKVLDFNLAGPTTHTFLLRYLKASEAEHLRPSLQTKASLVKPTASQLSETITYLAMVSEFALICKLFDTTCLFLCLVCSIFVNWHFKITIRTSSITHQS